VGVRDRREEAIQGRGNGRGSEGGKEELKEGLGEEMKSGLERETRETCL